MADQKKLIRNKRVAILVYAGALNSYPRPLP